MDFLNGGPDLYKKILFASFSLSNSGRICEHDVFTVIESFKQRDSFFFVGELINQKEVLKDYQNIKDNSDSVFYEAFTKDLKLICRIINMRKRLKGLVDMDTVKDL